MNDLLNARERAVVVGLWRAHPAATRKEIAAWATARLGRAITVGQAKHVRPADLAPGLPGRPPEPRGGPAC